MKKKLIAIVTVLAIVFAMTACSESDTVTLKDDAKTATPKEYVTSVLDATKTDSAAKIVKEAIDDSSFSSEEGAAPRFIKKIQEFDYKIVSEEKSGDATIFKIQITTYPFGKVYEDTYNALPLSLTNEAQLNDRAAEEMNNKLLTAITSTPDKNYTTDVEVKVVEKDGKWSGNFLSVNFLNAITGNLVATAAHNA